MVANFEIFLISPGFLLNFRKITKFERVTSKSLRVMDKNFWGVPKDPLGLNRIKQTLPGVTKYLRESDTRLGNVVLENIYHNVLHVLRAGGQTLRKIEIHEHFLDVKTLYSVT